MDREFQRDIDGFYSAVKIFKPERVISQVEKMITDYIQRCNSLDPSVDYQLFKKVVDREYYQKRINFLKNWLLENGHRYDTRRNKVVPLTTEEKKRNILRTAFLRLKKNSSSRLGLEALEVAKECLGLGEEGKNNTGWFIDMIHETNETGMWCSAFVGWCFEEACRRLNIEMPFERNKRAKVFWENVVSVGEIPKNPMPGDIILWDRKEEGSPDGHIGFVESIKNGKVYTIEGNRRPVPSTVRRFSYDLKDLQNKADCSDGEFHLFLNFGRTP